MAAAVICQFTIHSSHITDYRKIFKIMTEIEQRVKKARELHEKGCNCCQAVVMAYADMLPMDEQTAMNMAAPFGRGISGLRETCGCVTGMALVCGLTGQKMMVKGLGERFRQENGELNCAKLLMAQGKDHSCNDLVACAAKLLGEALLDE